LFGKIFPQVEQKPCDTDAYLPVASIRDIPKSVSFLLWPLFWQSDNAPSSSYIAPKEKKDSEAKEQLIIKHSVNRNHNIVDV